MTNSHTPGPWTVDPEGQVAVSVEGANGTVICDVHGAANDALCSANARLIAAAPELLAALRELMQSGEEAADSYSESDLQAAINDESAPALVKRQAAAFLNARRVIAKAEGRQQ